MLLGIFLAFNACSSDDNESDKAQTEQPDEPGTDSDEPNSPNPNPDAEKTLIVYYSFTSNVHTPSSMTCAHQSKPMWCVWSLQKRASTMPPTIMPPVAR